MAKAELGRFDNFWRGLRSLHSRLTQNFAKQLGQEVLDSRNCRKPSGHCYRLLQHSSKELHRWQEGTREVQVINSKRRGTRKLIAQEM